MLVVLHGFNKYNYFKALVSNFGIWTSLDGTLLQSQSCSRFYEVTDEGKLL